MRLHRNLSIQVAGAQNLQAGADLLDHTQFEQPAGIEAVALELLQAADVHDDILFAEDIGEAALRQAAVKRHLAAFKTAHHAIAGDRTGALCAAPGILASAGAHALPDALLLLLLPLGRPEIAEVHVTPSRSPVGAGSSTPCPGKPAYRAAPPHDSFS